MPRVRFTADFDYSPTEYGGRVTLAYKAGTVALVKQECADEANRLGRAELIEVPDGKASKRR